MAGLVVIQGPTDKPVYEVPAAADLTIGRGLDNLIVLENPAVSRHHARLCLISDAFWIEDLNSSNGVYLNGVKIHSATLRDGDQIQVGGVILVYREGA